MNLTFRLLLILVFDLGVHTTFAQQWLWVQDNKVLNPSGLDIRTYSTQFQVLDWNGDGLWDFVTNETGKLTYFEQVPGEEPFWVNKAMQFPEIGLNDMGIGSYPKNFRFFDWDQDGAL